MPEQNLLLDQIAGKVSNIEQLPHNQWAHPRSSSRRPRLISVTESVVLPPDENLAYARGGSDGEFGEKRV
jgi:hypothetical protein